MATPARTGALAAAAGWTRAAAWAPDWRSAFSERARARGRAASFLPVDSSRGDGRGGAQSGRRPRAGPVAAGADDGFLRHARVVLPRPASRSRSFARNRRAVRRFFVDVAAHGARRRAGARPHPHCLAARLCRGSGLEDCRRAHGDRRRQRRRHAAREGSAPRQSDDPQHARRRGRRLCRAQGAPAAALARISAGRI